MLWTYSSGIPRSWVCCLAATCLDSLCAKLHSLPTQRLHCQIEEENYAVRNLMWAWGVPKALARQSHDFSTQASSLYLGCLSWHAVAAGMLSWLACCLDWHAVSSSFMQRDAQEDSTAQAAKKSICIWNLLKCQVACECSPETWSMFVTWCITAWVVVPYLYGCIDLLLCSFAFLLLLLFTQVSAILNNVKQLAGVSEVFDQAAYVMWRSEVSVTFSCFVLGFWFEGVGPCTYGRFLTTMSALGKVL